MTQEGNPIDYASLKKNMIVSFVDDSKTHVNVIILDVSERDIANGTNADKPGFYGFRGLWYKGNGTKKMSYGKIYDLRDDYYKMTLVRSNIRGLKKRELQHILK